LLFEKKASQHNLHDAKTQSGIRLCR